MQIPAQFGTGRTFRLVSALTWGLGVVHAAEAQGAAAAAAKPGPVFVNGTAQIVPAFQDSTRWIRQHLWVETDFDTDHDGKKDRVFVDVTRPGQTESDGLKVSIVYGSSPYYAGTARVDPNWDVKQELDAESPPREPATSPPYRADRIRISNALVNQWVPRGFAVVHSEASGTGQSQGCPTVGDYPERMAMKFVIDWLNGRAKGFTSKTGTDEVTATAWSTGKVGMIGTSYEGTLPLAAATTGVQGLEVVVPVSPNTSYYNYYRANGLVRSPGGYLGEDVDVLYDFVASGDTAGRANCDRIWKRGVFAGATGQDRATGDYNAFWAARDLVPWPRTSRPRCCSRTGRAPTSRPRRSSRSPGRWRTAGSRRCGSTTRTATPVDGRRTVRPSCSRPRGLPRPTCRGGRGSTPSGSWSAVARWVVATARSSSRMPTTRSRRLGSCSSGTPSTRPASPTNRGSSTWAASGYPRSS
mgnify:CR=1 FL=1